MYQIVLEGQMGTYFMKANRSFVFYSEDAATFGSRDEAQAELTAAVKRGKKAMFAKASVQVMN